MNLRSWNHPGTVVLGFGSLLHGAELHRLGGYAVVICCWCFSRTTDDGQQLRAGRKEGDAVAQRVLDMSFVITFCFRKGQGSDWACAGSFLRQKDCIPNTVQCHLLMLLRATSATSLSHCQCFSVSGNLVQLPLIVSAVCTCVADTNSLEMGSLCQVRFWEDNSDFSINHTQ